MTTPGDIFIKLKRPCPRCQGVLERYEAKAVAGNPVPLPKVHCTGCQTEWSNMHEMLLEAHKGREAASKEKPKRRGPTMADMQGYLAKLKAGVRAGRNVAASVRAVSEHLASITGRVRELEKAPDKQAVIAQVGQNLEGIVDQLTLAMEHIQEGRVGEVGPEPELEHGEDDKDG